MASRTATYWAALAAVLGTVSSRVVFVFQVGPVVLVISQKYGHGVHIGDLLIGVPFGMAAVGAAVVFVKQLRESRPLVG